MAVHDKQLLSQVKVHNGASYPRAHLITLSAPPLAHCNAVSPLHRHPPSPNTLQRVLNMCTYTVHRVYRTTIVLDTSLHVSNIINIRIYIYGCPRVGSMTYTHSPRIHNNNNNIIKTRVVRKTKINDTQLLCHKKKAGQIGHLT